MFKFSSKYIKLFLLLTVFCQISLAQFQTFPLRNTEVSKKSPAKIAALALPFFDDFSTSINQPSQQKWVKGGGVFINNNASLTHPTLNMATFDGLKANGVPYNYNDPFANGATDSLTSLPIDLSRNNIVDSLYLSFFYQTQGLGEKPDLNDSLTVQFLTDGGKWITEKVFVGDTVTNSKFVQVLMPIRSVRYLHAGFQFRFRTFGKQSGQFDAWHIDYVFLDKNRTLKNTFFADIACQNPLSSVLKRYNSMPMKQFQANPTRELSETIKGDIYNLFSNQRSFPVKYSIQNLITQEFLVQKILPDNPNIPKLSAKTIEVKNELGNLVKDDRALLKIKFDLNSGDIPLFQVNDTISRIVELDNYYAYDDGTAEAGAYLKKGFGRVAVMFINNKADVVKAIRINLQTFLDSTRLAATNLSLQIMANDRGKPGRILRGLSSKIIYPKTNNGFVEYTIEPIAVADTFYVGYTQLSDDESLIVGVDNDSPQFAKNHFYNIANEWINVGNVSANSGFVPIKGSLMIRPVMGGVAKETEPLATEEEIQDRNLVISPNPTSNIIRWNDASLKNAEIMDMSGRSILLEKSDNQAINIEKLNTGTYLLRLSNDKNTFVRKIVKL